MFLNVGLALLATLFVGRNERAVRLGAFVGDTVNVVSPVGPISAMGMVPKIRTFAVVGLFHSGMYEYDSSLAYMALEEAH